MHKATQYFEVQRLIRIPKQQLSNISDFGGTIALCNLLVLWGGMKLQVGAKNRLPRDRKQEGVEKFML